MSALARSNDNQGGAWRWRISASLKTLLGAGYSHPRLVAGIDGWAAIRKAAFMWAIVLCDADEDAAEIDAWCYPSLEAAREALASWHAGDEPLGWTLHPISGRLRLGGDPDAECIALAG